MDITERIAAAETQLAETFKTIAETALYNQEKVLRAFQNNKLAMRHFSPTNGYGYDDIGRDTLNRIFADVFATEAAIVSPSIASGTHALTLGLFGLLRPGDCLLSIAGMPYDTLEDVITGSGNGSLRDYGVQFECVALREQSFDFAAIEKKLQTHPKVVFIQRSRGYSWRNAFTVEDLAKAIALAKKISPQSIVVVDNCYGEFIETREPTDVGADVVIGSLIKNPGGGLAPTGGYLAGKAVYIEQIGYRLTAPGIGCEVGSYAASYRPFYQGVFMAPHVVSQALKTALLFAEVFRGLGYETLPARDGQIGDIICSIRFAAADQLIGFCQAIQKASPIDSFVVPEPWDMPGYAHPVIMAAGTFVQGASIELSADSPIKEPYIAYLQGGLTYEHGKLALTACLETLAHTA